MKQIIAIFIIILLFIGLSMYTNFYLETSSQNIVSHIDNIETFCRHQDWNSINKELQLVNDKWENTKTIWSMLIEHDEVDKIESSLSKVSKYIESKNTSEILAENSNLKVMVKHIPQTYFLNLENIF